MGKYAVEAAGALADVQAAGAQVTFTSSSPGTYDAATDTYSAPVTTTVAGHAIRTRGDPLRYQALELVQSEAPTLVFTPTTYGAVPSLGMTVVWGGLTYTVRDVEPLAPDGTAILSRVIVAR